MILTIGKVVTYGESIVEEDLQQFTETIEYILRVENAMADINTTPIKLDEFVKTQGNLMDQIAKKAYLDKIRSKYDGITDKFPSEVYWFDNGAKTLQNPELIDATTGTEEAAPAAEPAAAEEPASAERRLQDDPPAEGDAVVDPDASADTPVPGPIVVVPELATDDVTAIDEEFVEQCLPIESKELCNLRKMLKKNIVLKNAHLDQLCESLSI